MSESLIQPGKSKHKSTDFCGVTDGPLRVQQSWFGPPPILWHCFPWETFAFQGTNHMQRAYNTEQHLNKGIEGALVF